MERRSGTESALDAALDALLAGDKQSLLKAIRIVDNHPRAEELRHLLTSAIETREAIRATPSVQARVRHLRMIGLACREQGRARAARKARDVKRMRGLVFRPLAIAGAALGLLLPGALALASTARPGDALYGAKLTVEQVQLALTTSPEAEIALHLKFADRRIDEVQRLEQRGTNAGPALKAAVSNLESHSAAVKNAVEAMSDSGHPPAELTEALERHRNGITDLQGKTGCDRSQSSAGCEGLQTALADSTSALKQLRSNAPSRGGSKTLARGGGPAGRPPGSGLKTDKGPGKPPVTAPASPTTAPSESAAPSGSPEPSASPSPEPSPSPSPDASPSPSPGTSASPSPGPTEEPSPSSGPIPTISSEPPPAQTEPAPAAPPNGADTIEPHATGEVVTPPLS